MNDAKGNSIKNMLKYGKMLHTFQRLDIYYDPHESLRNFKGFSPAN